MEPQVKTLAEKAYYLVEAHEGDAHNKQAIQKYGCGFALLPEGLRFGAAPGKSLSV